MKMIFCYDGPIDKHSDGAYYSPALNNKMFERYKCISNDIRIAIRVREVKENMKKKLDGDILSKDKYKIINCPNISSLKGIILEKKKCRKILECEIKKVDFLIIRLPSMIGNLALEIAKKYKKPYLIEMVGCPWDALWNYSLKGKLIAPYMTFVTKNNIKNAPYVLYVTSQFLQKRYPTKGKNINCSNVMLDEIDLDVVKKVKNKILNKESNKIILATIAAVDVKYKGQQYVIKAISNLKKKGYNFEYHIIGSGNNQFLKKLAEKLHIKNEVKFIGPIAHDKIFSYLDKVDIYIQPSKQEGLPRALIEAMSKACPCIGSKTGGIPELVDNKYIFPKGNSKKLERILETFSKEDMIIQSEENFKKAKLYERETLKNKREKFYKDFIENSLDKNIKERIKCNQ